MFPAFVTCVGNSVILPPTPQLFPPPYISFCIYPADIVIFVVPFIYPFNVFIVLFWIFPLLPPNILPYTDTELLETITFVFPVPYPFPIVVAFVPPYTSPVILNLPANVISVFPLNSLSAPCPNIATALLEFVLGATTSPP